MDSNLILDTLELVADRVGDPQPQVYARLFELRPDYEELFVMDTDGGVRGTMLQTCLDCLIGVAEGNHDLPRFQLDAARLAHDAYGLKDDEVQLMFVAMRDCFQDILGADWTPAHGTAWDGVLETLQSMKESAD